MLKLLPIGSIVTLNGGEKKLMIYGRKQTDAAKNIEYDYLGCPYPEGFIEPKLTFLFNQADVKEIVFKGYTDNEETRFVQALSDFYENLK